MPARTTCVCSRGVVRDHCQFHGLEATARRIGRSLAEKYGGPFDVARAMLAGKLNSHEQQYAVERLLTPAVVSLATAAQAQDNARVLARATERAGHCVAKAARDAATIAATTAWELR